MLWIKDTLEDTTALLKQGWIYATKTYDNNRRVALVKDNYVVIIMIYAPRKARFVTAYQIENEETLKKFLAGPDWVK